MALDAALLDELLLVLDPPVRAHAHPLSVMVCLAAGAELRFDDALTPGRRGPYAVSMGAKYTIDDLAAFFLGLDRHAARHLLRENDDKLLAFFLSFLSFLASSSSRSCGCPGTTSSADSSCRTPW